MKKAIITGTSSGIGLSSARLLLKENWSVVGISRTKPDLNHNHYSHQTIDLKDLETLPEKFKTLAKEVSTIDALICNAGSGLFGNLEECSFSSIQDLIHLNFLSQVFLIKSFLPSMKRQKSGSIICMGSEAALAGKRKGSIYCASKFALRGFTQALREECASDGIRVALINPGMVKTPFFDSLNFSHGDNWDEYIDPEDVAQTIAFILKMRNGTVFDEINLFPQKQKIQFKSV